MIKIWNPRWHDKKVLIAKYKVHPGVNQIKFIKGTLKDRTYYILQENIINSPVESNGKISCYSVDLDKVLQCPIG